MITEQVCNTETLGALRTYDASTLIIVERIKDAIAWTREYDYYPDGNLKSAYTSLVQTLGPQNPLTKRFFGEVLMNSSDSFPRWDALDVIGENKVPLKEELSDLLRRSFNHTTIDATRNALVQLERNVAV